MQSNCNQYEVLAKLAGHKIEDEYSHAIESDVQNSDIAQALKEIREEEKKETVKRAAKVVLDLTKKASSFIEESRGKLRSVRAQEKLLKDYIQRTAVLQEYGNLTSDYRPLASFLEPVAVMGSTSFKFSIDEKMMAKAEENVKKRFSKAKEPEKNSTTVTVSRRGPVRTTTVKLPEKKA